MNNNNENNAYGVIKSSDPIEDNIKQEEEVQSPVVPEPVKEENVKPVEEGNTFNAKNSMFAKFNQGKDTEGKKRKYSLKHVLIIIAIVVGAYLAISFFIVRSELRRYIAPKNDVREITVEQIEKVTTAMTYLEVLDLLGSTKDIGFIKPTAKYKVGDKFLYIGFVYIHDKNSTTALGYIESLTYKDHN